MGLLDNLKGRLAPAKEKVSDLAQRHPGPIDKIEHGLDRAAKLADEKTKGKYSDKIQTRAGKAKDALDRLAHKERGGTDGGAAPPPPPTS
ncbi:antitoxin [Streptomyces sporangiiformans]|uniref:Antitoxin n=1 Tax=Streptomyces sporangiiformans TaxID=2315329 RepID=A0A505D930_9ACTN|nr:antitoxin [Streptomyces sporangiiformans]TPQ15926.1 antitoxin [Streptomyces sporangiiformans]